MPGFSALPGTNKWTVVCGMEVWLVWVHVLDVRLCSCFLGMFGVFVWFRFVGPILAVVELSCRGQEDT